MPVAEAVEVRDLVKRYGTAVAVDGATWTAPLGEVTAVLGPNGAGKTTTIECCEALRLPDAGTVRVLGIDPRRGGPALHARVGVMLQDGGLPSGARAVDLLRLVSSFHVSPHRPAQLLDLLGLAAHARTPVRRLSGGQRQLLALALALVGRPQVAFLDEPTAGLDPQARLLVWDLVRRLRNDGVGIVLTTHLLDEAERLADRVVVMAAGRVVAAGTPGELTSGSGGTLSFDAPPGLDLVALDDRLPAGIRLVEIRPGRYAAECAPAVVLDPGAVAVVTAWCAEQGVMPAGLVLGRRTLEDVVLEFVAPGAEPR